MEIKGDPEKPEVTLDPGAYAEKVVQVVRDEDFADRVNILSFDWRTLRRVREIAPDIVYVHCTGFGSGGPYEPLQAYDDVIQGASGTVLIFTDAYFEE